MEQGLVRGVTVVSLVVFLFALSGVKSATHWIATDDGEVKPQAQSIFAMRDPSDLAGLIQQEKRLETVKALRKELLQRKEEIDRCEDEAENIEERLYAEDTDCQTAGVPLTELDLYVSTVVPFEGKIKPQKAYVSGSFNEPDCSKYLQLDFSMHAYEHLLGVRERKNLTMIPETGLHKAICLPEVENVEHFGQHVTSLLDSQANWTTFNLAALYWREKGDATRAIECVRRALHLSPHEVKDVALISLANVLHRGHLSEEAAIVVHAAIDIAPDNAICHFTLGNIYAVLAEYNKSMICYENMLRLQPEFSSARQRLHAVRCHAKVELALESQHSALQSVLDKLKEYQQKKETYVQLMHKLAEEAAPLYYGPPDPNQNECEGRIEPDKHQSKALHCSRNGEEPPGFPFFDNMMDLQFNVRPEDRERARQACEEDDKENK